MSRKKGPDEIYCRTCGEPIKKKAEICPECGVPNEYKQEHSSPQSHQNTTQTTQNTTTNRGSKSDLQQQVENEIESTVQQIFSSSESSTHDPSEYTTTVSNNWHYGVAASVVFWLIGLAVPMEFSTIAGLFMISGWALMPISIYNDRQWVRATTQWDPSLAIWIILSIVPVVNIVAGAVYLFRRNNVSRVSSPNRGRSTRRENDDALEELRERYSRGELTDEEFEQKVEQIVGTEDPETAQVHMRAKERSEE